MRNTGVFNWPKILINGNQCKNYRNRIKQIFFFGLNFNQRKREKEGEKEKRVPVKTMRSGFSAEIMRLIKAVVLRSEQPATWLGSTSKQGVVLPFAKCISATCRILNSPFCLNRSFLSCFAFTARVGAIHNSVSTATITNAGFFFRCTIILTAKGIVFLYLLCNFRL